LFLATIGHQSHASENPPSPCPTLPFLLPWFLSLLADGRCNFNSLAIARRQRTYPGLSDEVHEDRRA
jgi:hypothetical protein